MRKAEERDLDAMVAMASIKRAQYEAWQPVFHKMAPGADAKQRLFLKDQLAKADSLLLVAEGSGSLMGWLYLRLVGAPPVYEPGGKVALVDDFCVQGEDWATTGSQLLQAARAWAKQNGAVLINVVCGPKDNAKRALLVAQGLDVASEWHVAAL